MTLNRAIKKWTCGCKVYEMAYLMTEKHEKKPKWKGCKVYEMAYLMTIIRIQLLRVIGCKVYEMAYLMIRQNLS